MPPDRMDMHDPVHPGEVLTGWIDDLGISITDFWKVVSLAPVPLSFGGKK